METSTKISITIEATVNAPVSKVWQYWNLPEHITRWCQASGEWHAPFAENDIRTGGKFRTTMAAKDGSMSFDFEGVYTKVEDHIAIEYMLGDNRTVCISMTELDGATKIVETFEAENENPIAMQRDGWQAILDSFKNYTETH